MKKASKDLTISGFSKLSKRGKIKWLAENFFKDPETVMRELMSFWHRNEDQQKVLDAFSENTISNYTLPYSVAPNFVINGKTYCVPMVIEESSVVAAASSSAKYWMTRGGFKAKIIDDKKVGQIHLKFHGPSQKLHEFYKKYNNEIILKCKPHTKNMEKRGGGLISSELLDFERHPGYYQIRMNFKTCDSMGANFINTVLEAYATEMQKLYARHLGDEDLDILMCILSNYTPECLVRVEAKCAIEKLGTFPNEISAGEFARRFQQAINIAKIDTYRATTHNKGIFNGIDSVVIATGNDFRAVEACGHAYASRNGQYQSLSSCEVKDGLFTFSLEVPLALGTIGGLTKLHPMAKRSLELLGNPSAKELMMIVGAVGLAQNFAAIRSLITTGIQKGHMKMHLTNVLNQLQATEREIKLATEHFSDKIISHSAVRDFIEQTRKLESQTGAKINS